MLEDPVNGELPKTVKAAGLLAWKAAQAPQVEAVG